MSLQPLNCVGIVIPPSNPTLEVEIKRLLGKRPYLYSSRLPVFPSCDLQERNRRYLDHYLDSSLGFGRLPLSGILVGLTGSNYVLGPTGDRQLCNEISARLNVPFATTSLAILEMVRLLKFNRLHLELPYPQWMIGQAKLYWEQAGIEVVAANSILDALNVQSAYAIDDLDLEDYLKALKPHDGAPILLSGTGMRTVGALEDLVDRFSVPLLSSNLAAARWLLRHCGDSESRGSLLYRKLYQKLVRFASLSDWTEVDALFNPFD